MKKLPFLISIPHGGNEIPGELRDNIAISEKDIFDDIDPFTREIYETSDVVEKQVTTGIARTFVDLNRSPDQLPPAWPDGIIKTVSCYNKSIYKPGLFPDSSLIAKLIQKYYDPYHFSIAELVKDESVWFCFDCHSMADHGPEISPDPGKKRPLINLGDADGNSCDEDITLLLKDCFAKVFELNEDDITINIPFKGGYITRTYGGKPKPWVQIEISRALYLTKPWFNSSAMKTDKERIAMLNSKFRNTLVLFHNEMLKYNLYD